MEEAARVAEGLAGWAAGAMVKAVGGWEAAGCRQRWSTE